MTSTVLHLSGELDINSRVDLRRALTEILADAPGTVVVDLTQVRFCGAAEFGLLAALGPAAAARGIRCAVSGLGPDLDRVARLIWGPGWPERYASTAAAVTACVTTRAAV